VYFIGVKFYASNRNRLMVHFEAVLATSVIKIVTDPLVYKLYEFK
jgi:hypothetical protein